MAPERRAVGMVFQDYALFPHLDVAANVGFGLPRRERARRGCASCSRSWAWRGWASARPASSPAASSSAWRWRGRWRPSPKLVLLDEPWSAIDALLREEMREELARVLREQGVTVVLVTHDREEAFTLADRIALMRDGRVVQCGIPEELYFRPADRWAARFVGASNMVPADLARHLGANGDVAAGAGEVLLRPERIGLEIDPSGPRRGGAPHVPRPRRPVPRAAHRRDPAGRAAAVQRARAPRLARAGAPAPVPGAVLRRFVIRPNRRAGRHGGGRWPCPPAAAGTTPT